MRGVRSNLEYCARAAPSAWPQPVSAGHDSPDRAAKSAVERGFRLCMRISHESLPTPDLGLHTAATARADCPQQELSRRLFAHSFRNVDVKINITVAPPSTRAPSRSV